MRLLFKILFLSVLASQETIAKDADIQTQILESIRKNSPICKTCNFIVQTETNNWLKSYTLYKVTTFDIFPPATWHVGARDQKLYFLDHRNINGWNNVVASEKIFLNDDEKVVSYVKFFLATTMNQSEYIATLSPGEVNRIQTKDKKKVDPKTKIVRTADKIQIVFYASDSQGDLQEWNLVLSKKGEIFENSGEKFFKERLLV